MIVTAKPFLLFEGNCAEALELYQKIFNGKLVEKILFGEMFPQDDTQTAEPVASELANKISFATFQIGNLTIAAGDHVLGEKLQARNNISLLLEIESKEALEKAYSDLVANDSQVIFKLGKSEWSQLYAKVQDKYGVLWELNFEGN